MNNHLAFFTILGLFLFGCETPTKKSKNTPTETVSLTPTDALSLFTLKDFFNSNPLLDQATDSLYEHLSLEASIGQRIITAYTGKYEQERELLFHRIAQHQIAGILVLEKQSQIATDLSQFRQYNLQSLGVPLLFMIDGEPGILHARLPASPSQLHTYADQLESDFDVKEMAIDMTGYLAKLGFHLNLAPVCDIASPSSLVAKRSFGYEITAAKPRIQTFIRETQGMGMVATAKHFPGHGKVQGDSHLETVFIEGELTELPAFEAAIDVGVLSILVGHIGVRGNSEYDTQGLPATLSENIIQQLLRKKMGFEGLILTDAMDMKGVSEIPNAVLLALKAGNDLLLAPQLSVELIHQIREELLNSPDMMSLHEASVKRILRMKICLGLYEKAIDPSLTKN
ncbi:MAG: glycoside hydrolase family 3 N-terminal domain-containing protein [Bacteroidota bacterium]